MGSTPWKVALLDLWDETFSGRRVRVTNAGSVRVRGALRRLDEVEGVFLGWSATRDGGRRFVDLTADDGADVTVVLASRAMRVVALDTLDLAERERLVHDALVRLGAFKRWQARRKPPGTPGRGNEPAWPEDTIEREVRRAAYVVEGVRPMESAALRRLLGLMAQEGTVQRVDMGVGRRDWYRLPFGWDGWRG